MTASDNLNSANYTLGRVVPTTSLPAPTGKTTKHDSRGDLVTPMWERRNVRLGS